MQKMEHLTSESEIFSGAFHSENLSLFSKLPPEHTWIRHGLVERQTMSADVQWHPRLMILTSTDIVFARPNTDLIVDRLHLKDVIVVNKVDSNESSKKKRRSSVMFAASFKVDAMEDIYDGARDSYAFEIRTSVGDRQRSYFARVDSAEDCEAWVADIKAAQKESRTQLASGDSWWTWTQERARSIPLSLLTAHPAQQSIRAGPSPTPHTPPLHPAQMPRKLHDSTALRCGVSLAIFLDFCQNVLKTELLPADGRSATYAQACARKAYINVCEFTRVCIRVHAQV